MWSFFKFTNKKWSSWNERLTSVWPEFIGFSTKSRRYKMVYITVRSIERIYSWLSKNQTFKLTLCKLFGNCGKSYCAISEINWYNNFQLKEKIIIKITSNVKNIKFIIEYKKPTPRKRRKCTSLTPHYICDNSFFIMTPISVKPCNIMYDILTPYLWSDPCYFVHDAWTNN